MSSGCVEYEPSKMFSVFGVTCTASPRSITPETQSARILKRNGPARHKMFVEKWIPLENLYFTSYPVEKQCDLVFTT